MATHNSVQAALLASGAKLDGRINGGALRRFRFHIVLDGQAAGDTINLGKKPRGFDFSFGVLNTDTSLGAATAAIGVAGNTGKYRAAAVLTTPNIPVLFGKQAAGAAAEGDEEDLILTIAADAFPGAGNLSVEIFASERT